MAVRAVRPGQTKCSSFMKVKSISRQQMLVSLAVPMKFMTNAFVLT
jgi:hypothetical protein